MEALKLSETAVPGRRVVPVTRKLLCSSVFPVDRTTGLRDLRGFQWGKKRRPKDPRLLALPDASFFPGLVWERFSLQTLALVHSDWCYANQITPSQVATFIEKTLDRGYWQDDSADIKMEWIYDYKSPHLEVAWADKDSTLWIPKSEIDLTSTNHINDPQASCSCRVSPREADLSQLNSCCVDVEVATISG